MGWTKGLPPVYDGLKAHTLTCDHSWRLEDRAPPGTSAKELAERGDWWMCEVCEKCRGIRCDSYGGADKSRCVHVRHHRVEHEYEKGGVLPIGGIA